MSNFERGLDPKHAMRIGKFINQDIIDRIKEIIEDTCGSDIDYSKSFKNNDIDELDYIEILMYFEREWDIQIDDDNMPSISINEYIDELVIKILNR